MFQLGHFRIAMAKAGVRAVKLEVTSVSLQTVAPSISQDKEEKEQLLQYLTRMGCEGLLKEPWILKNRAMVQEFVQSRSNQWEGTIQRLPDKWMADSWAEVYGFRKEGRTIAGRTDQWIDGKFRSSINSKDGHAVDDCVNPRKRRILEFVVPIIILEKPKQVTKVVGNTIFSSLCREYKVNWDQVIHEVVHRLVAHLEKKKPSPISPYLFHLYSRNKCLKE